MYIYHLIYSFSHLVVELKPVIYSYIHSTYHGMYIAQGVNKTMMNKIDANLVLKKLLFRGSRTGFLEAYIGSMWY